MKKLSTISTKNFLNFFVISVIIASGLMILSSNWVTWGTKKIIDSSAKKIITYNQQGTDVLKKLKSDVRTFGSVPMIHAARCHSIAEGLYDKAESAQSTMNFFKEVQKYSVQIQNGVISLFIVMLVLVGFAKLRQ